MYEIFEQLLKANGVTPYRVAKDTGIPCATLTNWKQGKYVPKIEKLQKIADYFQVPLPYLLEGTMPEGPGQDMELLLSKLLREVKSPSEKPLYYGAAPITPQLRELLEMQLDTLLHTAALLTKSQQGQS